MSFSDADSTFADVDTTQEIDLLRALGVPNQRGTGVTYTVGVDGYPAFQLSSGADIRETAGAYFLRPLYAEFAIVMTIRPYTRSPGYIFAVVNPSGAIVQLGVLIEAAGEDRQHLKLYYTPNSLSAVTSEVIASFNIPSIGTTWTKIGLKVETDEITLYINCNQEDRVLWSRRVQNLEIEPGSALYIGQAGHNHRNVPPFEVSFFGFFFFNNHHHH